MTGYQGHMVSAGVAAGELYLPDAPAGADRGPVGADVVRSAFAAVAADRIQLAERLRADGRNHEADIVYIGALIAADPALVDPALDAAWSGVPAVTAVRNAAEGQAAVLEALPDPDLALRAGDVRQIAEAVVDLLTGASPAAPARPFILVRRDVDPADLIRLADGRLVGAVSVGGGASSHAAIIARGLGLPMLAGADEAVLAAPAGRQAIIDAAAGQLVVDPSPADLARSGLAPSPLAPGHLPPSHLPPSHLPPSHLPPSHLNRAIEVAPVHSDAQSSGLRTADGELVTVLCNVASAAETRLGLAGGAAGVGLLRTEIPFTSARRWPTRDDHLAELRPVLGLLTGRKAVVRLLDFSGDKIPPFPGAEGLRALLDAPGALRDQLAAILAAGAGTDLAIMIPMVRSLDEVERVRGELASVANGTGIPLGMMVELAATAAAAERFAPHVDFFSIGTNDLTADILHRDRVALPPSAAAEPPVPDVIAHVVRAARLAGIEVSVCGDSAADPAVLPLLIGAGVRTVSVGAALVPRVARWIAEIDAAGGS